MKRHDVRASRKGIKLPDELPFVAFATVQQYESRPLPLPASLLCRRYGLSPSRARLVAELAGFYVEASQ